MPGYWEQVSGRILGTITEDPLPPFILTDEKSPFCRESRNHHHPTLLQITQVIIGLPVKALPEEQLLFQVE
jgi:hypothetical protein